jgi:hypothetical protein
MQKDKKKFIALVIIAILLVVGILYLLLSDRRTQDATDTGFQAPFFGLFGGQTTPLAPIPTPEPTTPEDVFFDIEEGRRERLFKISSFPARGAWVQKDDWAISNFSIRFLEKETGFIHQAPVQQLPQTKRLTGMNLPPMEEVFFLSNETMVTRFWNESNKRIQTLLGTLEDQYPELPKNIQICESSYPTTHIDEESPEESILALQSFLSMATETPIQGTGKLDKETTSGIQSFRSMVTGDEMSTWDETFISQLQTVCRLVFETARSIETGEETQYEVRGPLMPDNITSIVPSPDKNRLFYLIKTDTGSTGYVLNQETNSVRLGFESTFSEWKALWPKSDALTVTTKPSSLVQGFGYLVNSLDFHFSRFIRNRFGLTTLLAGDGNNAIVSFVQNNELRTQILHISSQRVISINPPTLPDKCVWSNKDNGFYCGIPSVISSPEQQPDLWYQGMSRFFDDIWFISVTGEKSLISQPMLERGELIDIWTAEISHDEKWMYIINKEDETLWILDLRSDAEFYADLETPAPETQDTSEGEVQ